MIIRLAERDIKTKFGVFRKILYYDGQTESIALVMSNVGGQIDAFCRIYSNCIFAHVFKSIGWECREEMESPQALIEQKGKGVIIYLDQEGKGNGHLALMTRIKYKKAGFSQAEAYKKAIYEALSHNKNATVLEIYGVNHLFQTAQTGEPTEYAVIEETVSPKVLEIVAGWIETHSPPRRN